MQPIPYLFFNGTCAEAMAFYASVLGTPPPEIMPFSAMPEEVRAQMPGVPADAVMHAGLDTGDGWIYASDDPSGEAKPMEGCNIHLSLPTPEDARRVFDAFACGGEVRMPLEPAFWAPVFGTVSDKFGIRWMISADPQD
ncbi:VOC family protein [Primorskyibacter sedentarius]|uniref:VOC family protein n=1 Tax=Primorskyibacter sedentarius TaxID=745311 RepID=UPI003EB696E6